MNEYNGDFTLAAERRVCTLPHQGQAQDNDWLGTTGKKQVARQQLWIILAWLTPLKDTTQIQMLVTLFYCFDI